MNKHNKQQAMRLSVIILALLTLLALKTSAQKICAVSSPYRADVKVYVVDKEYQADLIVYKTDRQHRAKASENKGVWYFVDKEYQADVKVCFVEHEYQADIKVFFTDKEYRAGWRKESKRPLLY